jgi:hypothetical protein
MISVEDNQNLRVVLQNKVFGFSNKIVLGHQNPRFCMLSTCLLCLVEVFQQTGGIHMGTNYAPLPLDLFL